MEDQYGMADLRQFMSSSRPLFASIHQPQQTDFLSPSHRELAPPPPAPHHHYEMVMPPPGRGFEFLADSSTTTASAITGGASSAGFSGGGMEMEAAGGNGRWPRQETLTLLEIRSRLDSKFKEANQKGPIWDEVSRILCEEHGYQRSGKKCREKFENLYKYYKKTKDGKAGRQDGKHYRFFRQLEALYGETSNSGGGLISEIQTNFPYNNVGGDQTFFNNNNLDDDSLPSLSNSSDYDTTSSDEQPVDETMTAGNIKVWDSILKGLT